MTININRKSLNVMIIQPDPNKIDDWYLSKEDSERPERDIFIVNKFRKDWESIPISGDVQDAYVRIGNLASRSKYIGMWLASANLEYSLEASLPTYYKNLITNEEYTKLQEDVTKYNIEVTKLVAEDTKALNAYNKARETNKINFENKIKNISNNRIFKIVNLSSDLLPPEIHNTIANYTPIDEKSPNPKQYAREILINYKRALIGYVKADQNINVDNLIEELAGKR
jgi:hypothetical protein